MHEGRESPIESEEDLLKAERCGGTMTSGNGKKGLVRQEDRKTGSEQKHAEVS